MESTKKHMCFQQGSLTDKEKVRQLVRTILSFSISTQSTNQTEYTMIGQDATFWGAYLLGCLDFKAESVCNINFHLGHNPE